MNFTDKRVDMQKFTPVYSKLTFSYCFSDIMRKRFKLRLPFSDSPAISAIDVELTSPSHTNATYSEKVGYFAAGNC